MHGEQAVADPSQWELHNANACNVFFMHIPRGSPKNAFFFWLKKQNEKCSDLSFSMKHEENT